MLSDGALPAAELFSEVIKRVPLVLKHHVHAFLFVCLFAFTQPWRLSSKTGCDEETLDNVNFTPCF
ncbi:hypothetical protein CBW54_01340 [Yersinia kristensenii]|nr:hypothetical protein CBW54_01340 [Yersinia kristensenii]